MSKARVLIITGHGTNCDQETAFAARAGGAEQVEIVFFFDLLSGRKKIQDYNFIIFPGGFLDGDDLGAGQAAAQRWLYAEVAQTSEDTQESAKPSLLGGLCQVLENGGLFLGICNGFQLMVKLGLLPALDNKYFQRRLTLSHNDSARFEDRWVRLKVNQDSPCIFTKGLSELDLPIRHGEGKIITEDESTLKELLEKNLVALRYCDPETGDPTMVYPYNPNGSPEAIAGLTDPSGRVFGLMPHPEAFNHFTNHPKWTRGEKPVLGTEIFRNAVKFLHENA